MCHRSWAAGTPDKYKRDLMLLYLPYTCGNGEIDDQF